MLIIDPYRNQSSEELLRRVAFGFASTDLALCNDEYPDLEKDAGQIESNCGVGGPGMVELVMCYVNVDVQLQENIFADTTSSSVFWNDIQNWLFLNNFYGITFNAPSNTYFVDDPELPTYVLISLA